MADIQKEIRKPLKNAWPETTIELLRLEVDAFRERRIAVAAEPVDLDLVKRIDGVITRIEKELNKQ
ncbi:hypothetical protein [Sedimenticola hydrogenitrophicus]|uniref:hypothetical protein n=1 Tax=Sedimenticola hydrogenitrophicus TaxID=2967975 RepID=UPI0023AF6A35|nr:hypothetical protein [Sedimenticola hydrogenitrophicus]